MQHPVDLDGLRLVPSANAEAMMRRLADSADGNAAMNLGIMGGTFDPIHVGHLACAEMARDACDLDGVIFMVAPRQWMKQDRHIADARCRLDMCALATEGNPSFAVSALEVDRGGKTYTSDTLRTLHAVLPENVRLSFIIGADTLKTLPGWHEADVLSSMAQFICVDRPGRDDTQALLASARDKGFSVRWVDAPLLDISSSDIRSRIAEGKTVRYLLPDDVRDYIEENGLYEGVEL